MSSWMPSPEYNKVVEANRRYYAKTAALYDQPECCVTDAHFQSMLTCDLGEILGMLNKPPASIRVLDACGGSGNVTAKLLPLGVHVTLCDVSENLIALFYEKVQPDPAQVTTVHSEIGAFLATTDATFDLIVFSSALHHLEDVEGILSLASQRLAPNGLLYTVFDPTPRADLSLLAAAILRLDYYFFKLHKQPTDFPNAVLRRLRRSVSTGSNSQLVTDDNVGVIAEYHVSSGLDDYALVEQLQQMGLEKVWHNRYADARYRFTRHLLSRMGQVTNFKLLLRKL